MPAWLFLGGLAAGASALAARGAYRRRHQRAAADACGLVPAPDLTHVSTALQRTALWCLADGGFERRVVTGIVTRGQADIAITAFDLETLRERRGEWAWLPVEPPFRIGGTVSVVVCELDRKLAHVLLKRAGSGDRLADDDAIERVGHVAKNFRDRLGVARSYAAELPEPLPAAAADVALPDGWRAYTRDPAGLAALGLAATLARADRRDLVIELVDDVVVVYPAALDVRGPDALADLTETALAIADGVRAAAPAMR
ncbi:MAG: hypothetical protein ACM31C_05935 [Acidobacteriota bacterium]